MGVSYRKSNLPLAILAAGSLLLQLHRAGGQVLLNDGFLDGERLTQNLPTSAHWYSGGASSKVSFGEGGLILSGDTGGGTTGSIHGGGLAYFTVAGAPVSIVIGESITLSFEYGYAENDSSDWSLEFELYNSGASHVTADNTSFNSSVFNGYKGYEAAGILAVDPSSLGRYKIVERNLGCNNLLAAASYTIPTSPRKFEGLAWRPLPPD